MAQPQAAASEHFSPTNNIAPAYALNRWFKVVPADTPELREQVFRLRYQVYCCENQFEPPDAHPHQMERDIYDSRALHSMIIDRSSGTTTGTVRMILPDEKSPKTSFPVQQICHHPLPHSVCLSSSAEISRFAISKQAWEIAKKNIIHTTRNDHKVTLIPTGTIRCFIMLLLMREVVQLSLEHNITDWFAVMEPSLIRLLGSFGIHFAPIGPQVLYHGHRQPCHVHLATLLECIYQNNRDLWTFVTERRERLPLVSEGIKKSA